MKVPDKGGSVWLCREADAAASYFMASSLFAPSWRHFIYVRLAAGSPVPHPPLYSHGAFAGFVLGVLV
jgi:hypothetical protein